MGIYTFQLGHAYVPCLEDSLQNTRLALSLGRFPEDARAVAHGRDASISMSGSGMVIMRAATLHQPWNVIIWSEL